LLVTLILALGGFVWQGVAYLLLFLVTLVVCVFIASYRVWKEEYRASLEKDTLLEKARTDYSAILERLKPKVEILTETELEPSQKSRRIRVQSRCAVGCNFGVEIVRINPEISGFPLPFALRLIPETGKRVEFLPAGSSRTVDAVMYGVDFDKEAIFDDNRLVFLGVGDSGIFVNKGAREDCRITIHAYCDQEGKGDQKEFIIKSTEGIPEGPPDLLPV